MHATISGQKFEEIGYLQNVLVFLQDFYWLLRENSYFTVGKPSRHHLLQGTKVNIIINKTYQPFLLSDMMNYRILTSVVFL